MKLLMTGCQDDEFTCDDATCVGLSVRFDGRHDCKDGPDEANCQAFIISVGYNRFIVPSSKDGQLNITFEMNIKEIVNINELKGSIEIKSEIKRTWFDSQLTYQNIKKDKNNLMSPTDWDLTWTPMINFENIKSHDMIKKNDRIDVVKIIPNDDFEFVLGDDTLLHHTHLFKGSQNALQWERDLTVEWICNFHMQWYPFDTQSCTMMFWNEEILINFIPSNLSYLGPTELEQYIVKDFTICSTTINGDQGMVVEVVLGRPLFSFFLTTTLPTGMLIVISQMVTSFSDDFLDMVITVNLTVLLVLATL